MILSVAASPERGRGAAAAAGGAGVHRRRGGRQRLRRALAGRRAPRAAGRLHRGRRRGRRLLDHGRRPAALPDRVGGEGAGLDAADGARHRRPRLDAPPRQPGHPARAGGRHPGCARVAGRADAGDAQAGGGGGAAGARPTRPTPTRCWPRSARPRGCSAQVSATPPTRRCSRRATRSTWCRRSATARVDGRFLPGQEDTFLRRGARDRRRRRRGGVRDPPAGAGDQLRRRPRRRDDRGAAGRGPGRRWSRRS